MPLDLPVIDLTGDRKYVARALFEGIAGSACVWVEGHGIPDDVATVTVASARRFFALPRGVKAAVEWDGQGLWRGWQPAIEGGDRYGGATRGTDLLERLEQNFTPSHRGGVDRQGNRWPVRPADLRPAWEDYARRIGEVSSELIRLLAQVLELPADQLEPWTTGRSCNLVANYYPAVPPEAAHGRPRVQPHADHSGITVLLVDDSPGGLESRAADGTWHPVGYRPGALLIQAGTLLQHWTNGLLPPNTHRVRPPEPGARGRPDRLSMAWFHYPDRDVVVEPAPSCVGAGGARFGSVAAGSYAASRQAAYGRGEATRV